MMILGTGLCAVSAYFYISISKNIEDLLGQRLEFMARAAALYVPGEMHQEIYEAYKREDPDIAKKESFLGIQGILRQIQQANGLKSDVY